MKESEVEDSDQLDRETFEKTCLDLSKKPGSKYDFITRAGTSLKLALFNLFRIIWEKEILPEGWLESTIIQLKKGKRFDNDLDDIRNIHDRDLLSKIFSHMVISKANQLYLKTCQNTNLPVDQAIGLVNICLFSKVSLQSSRGMEKA